MPALTSVPVSALPYERFSQVLSPDRFAQFREAADHARRLLDGRVVWNINSTARGGGVAEMLVSLLAYARGAGINARWEVVSGNDPFFALTKRIHNNLHSSPGDGGELGDAERRIYEDALAANIAEFTEIVAADDIVIVHDPQPAGLIPMLKEQVGCTVIWRCHVGIDTPSDLSRRAWNFLLPYVEPAGAYVFSREAFVWDSLDRDKVEIIAPVIDAFSAKNQELSPEQVAGILAATGLQSDGATTDATFLREDGSPERVVRPTTLFEGAQLASEDPMTLQVSRWDRLKDPIGVIQGFVEHVLPQTSAHLVYAGPAVEAVADDPEGKDVLEEATSYFNGLPSESQARVHLACLPMDDLEENAAIVNALQRRANVVVQKSIAEGFGLTVAEGMWKARPVVASRIGGIQDQIVDGETGVLLAEPTGLEAYGEAVRGLLDDPERAHRIGLAAQARVRDEFLAVRSLMQYVNLIEKLLAN